MEGESVYCYDPNFEYFQDYFVTMKYDEPPICIGDEIYIPFFSQPPAPNSTEVPTFFPTPNFCFDENDCSSSFECGVGPSTSSRTLYVNVFAPFGLDNQAFQCIKTPCLFGTDPPSPSPVIAPTLAPVKAPTSAPTAAPTPSIFDLCFSGHTEVEVLGNGLTRMDALKIGDAVRSADGSFSKVYSFGHYDPFRVTKFLQIWTNENRHPLEITGDHLLYVVNTEKENAKLISASSVRVGDLLAVPQGSKAATVTSITTVERQGLYSPFTTTGNIVVNGAVASNYIALPAVFQDVTSFEQQHWLQHVAYTPYRLYCGTAGCQDEAYDEVTGLSGAVMIWLPLLHFWESVLPWAAHVLAAGLGYLIWKKQHGFKLSPATLK